MSNQNKTLSERQQDMRATIGAKQRSERARKVVRTMKMTGAYERLKASGRLIHQQAVERQQKLRNAVYEKAQSAAPSDWEKAWTHEAFAASSKVLGGPIEPEVDPDEVVLPTKKSGIRRAGRGGR